MASPKPAPFLDDPYREVGITWTPEEWKRLQAAREKVRARLDRRFDKVKIKGEPMSKEKMTIRGEILAALHAGPLLLSELLNKTGKAQGTLYTVLGNMKKDGDIETEREDGSRLVRYKLTTTSKPAGAIYATAQTAPAKPRAPELQLYKAGDKFMIGQIAVLITDNGGPIDMSTGEAIAVTDEDLRKATPIKKLKAVVQQTVEI